MTAINEIGTVVPNAILDNVIITGGDSSSDPAMIEFRFHIKEIIYDYTGKGSWITDENYLDKLRINIRADYTRGGSPVSSTTILPLPELFYPDIEEATALSKRGDIQNMYYEMGPKHVSLFLAALRQDGTLVAEYRLPNNLKFTAYISIPAGTDPDFDFDIKGAESSIEVVADGTVKTRTVGYFLGSSFYTGPRTQLANGRWVTGKTQNRNSQYLLERNVPNIKVLDARDIYESYEDLQALFLQPREIDLFSGAQDAGPYFSELNTTRDRDGVLRYLFTFNYKRAYSKNSIFANLFNVLPQSLRERILLFSNISNLSLDRTRIDGTGNEVTETVISSGETSGDRFIDSKTDLGSIREEEFKFEKGKLSLRTFSGNDSDFKYINAGKYKFSVRATIKDGMYKYLYFQEKDIEHSYSSLDTYKNRMELPDNNSGGSRPRPTPNFLEQINSESDYLNRPNIRALITLSENIYFYRNMSPTTATKVLNTLRYYLSPLTSDTMSVSVALSVLETIKIMMTVQRNLLLQNASTATSEDAPFGNTLIDNIDEEFADVFDATSSFKTGLFFLPAPAATSVETIGLSKITSQAFEKRIEDENRNFVNSNDTSFTFRDADNDTTSITTAGTSYSFLTPLSAMVDNMLYSIGSIAGADNPPGTPVTSLSAGYSKGRYRDLMSRLKNFNIADTGTGDFDMELTPEESADYSQETGDIVGEEQNKAAEAGQNLEDNLNSGGYKNPFKTTQVLDVIDNGKSVVIKGIDNKEHTLTREQFSKLPNYFKAMFSGVTNLGNLYLHVFDKYAAGDGYPYELIFGSVASVEALVGFDNIRAPKYVPLTEQVYRNGAGSNLLCRMKKYYGTNIGFERSNDAPIFNHYFLLETPTPPGGDNQLQANLNAASTIDEIINILEAAGYGEGDGDGDGDGELPPDITDGPCEILTDEQLAAQMGEIGTPQTDDALVMSPILEGESASFDGVLVDTDSADKLVSALEDLKKCNKDREE